MKSWNIGVGDHISPISLCAFACFIFLHQIIEIAYLYTFVIQLYMWTFVKYYKRSEKYGS